MYFLKYHPLKERLAARSVTDKEALPYLVVFYVSASLVTSFPFIEEFNKWDFVSGALSVLLAAGGILYAYRSNGGAEGFDLVQKYVVLGWVVVVRCLLASLPLLVVAYLAGEAFGIVTDETGPFDTMVFAVFELVLYWRIGRNIRDTRAVDARAKPAVSGVETIDSFSSR